MRCFMHAILYRYISPYFPARTIFDWGMESISDNNSCAMYECQCVNTHLSDSSQLRREGKEQRYALHITGLHGGSACFTKFKKY